MSSVLRTLRESDPGLIPVLAEVWKANIDGIDPAKAVEKVSKAMLDPARAEAVWDTLTDRERGAMQMITSSGSKMQESKFALLYGKIRQMGKGQIEQEKPHLKPQNIAEALFYKGLIGKGYENAETGARTIMYVPDDLLRVLPLKKTSYDNLEDEPLDESEFDEDDDEQAPDTPQPVFGQRSAYHDEADEDLPVQAAVQAAAPVRAASPPAAPTSTELDPLNHVSGTRPADTSIVDDMTTLLAYLQLNAPLLENHFLSRKDLDALMPHLLINDRARLSFLLGLGVTTHMIDVVGGRAQTNRVELRRWLGGTRSEQVKRLADAWRESEAYVDLWHVPGLIVEREAGTMNLYNPQPAREIVLQVMKTQTPAGWWSLEDFILLMREDHTDFQRPNSDFNSWYIRNQAGDYLSGIESWDAVDGALLEYIITGPMHWLGLLDSADDAARLTAYGRGFLGMTPFPNPADPQDKIELQADGTLLVSRKISRMDRFQVARFSAWVSAGDLGGKPYTYKLEARSIQRAAGQGIDTGHIGTFLTKIVNPLPPAVLRLLSNWQSGAVASVTFEQVIVVRSTSKETLDQIYDDPATRRFLGARLGDLAAIIRADQWEALRDALGESGIQVEIVGV